MLGLLLKKQQKKQEKLLKHNQINLQFLNEEVSLFSKSIEDLTKEKIELQVSLGILPPGDAQDEDPFLTQILTNRLEEDVLKRLEEAQELLAKTVEFTPRSREQRL